jgi:hypothetical protein
LNSGNDNVDKNNVEAEPVLTDDASGTDSSRHCALLDLAIIVTPRPSIGKKKAKAIAQAASANKKMKVQLPLPRSDSISNTSNDVALERLASAAETKNEVGKRMALAVETKNGIAKEQLMIQVGIANEQLMMQLFLANRNLLVLRLLFLPQSLESNLPT